MKEKLVADPSDLANSDTVVSIVSDGTNVAGVTPSGELKTSDATTQTTLSNIDGKLVDGNDIGDVTINNTSINPVPVDLTASTGTVKSLQIGTEDGSVLGTQFVFVNNEKQQVLAAHDREEDYTWADFGTKNERITRVDYTSVTFPGITVRQDLNYTLVGTKYRLDTIIWSIV